MPTKVFCIQILYLKNKSPEWPRVLTLSLKGPSVSASPDGVGSNTDGDRIDTVGSKPLIMLYFHSLKHTQTQVMMHIICILCLHFFVDFTEPEFGFFL